MDLLMMFKALSENLIPFLFMFLVVALVFRYIAYRAGRLNQAYFNTFSRSVQKILEDDYKAKGYEEVHDVDAWLDNLLEQVVDHLPDRSLRFDAKKKKKSGMELLRDYADGKRSVIIAVKQQSDALKSPHPPNFTELTRRILEQDNQWRTVLRIVPIDTLSRLFDIMPTLFIIGGIFGTFLGITSALPKIASIDLNNIEVAGPILNAFVSDVAFSMNTSIAGIACSVIMTVLTALFPLTSVRMEVRRNMDRALEFMWYQVHGNKVSRGERAVIELLERIHKTLSGSTKQDVKKVS